MGELADAREGAVENGTGAPALNIGDNPDAAGIVFLVRMVKPLRAGHLVVERKPWHVRLTILQESHGARVGILLRDKAFG